MKAQSILTVKNLNVYYNRQIRKKFLTKKVLFKAVNNASFALYPNEILGIVGESGSGKSTIAKAILGLQPAQGEINWHGQNLLACDSNAWKKIYKQIQIVFQDPLSSLNPRIPIGNIIAEPLQQFQPELSKQQRLQKVREWLDKVGISQQAINRYPHEFSGGQCQRISIARACIATPQLIICDEAVSALDVSIQAKIIKLLKTLQKELNIAMIFISHDLAVVNNLCNRVLVMTQGEIVEQGESTNVFNNPKHPYTKTLIDAIPRL